MKNKNIGILSFWTSDENYGQLLQLYSTNQVLLKLGYDPYIIKYDGVNDRTLKRPLYKRIITLIKNPERSLLQIKKVFNPPSRYAKINQNRHFDRFRQKYFKWTEPYKSFQELQDKSPYFYAYITGSDMVWASPNLSEAYFLNFGDRCVKRIAYAPSFGSNKLSIDYRRILPKLINNLDSVSIREENGKKLLEKICDREVEWLPDPTLLLTRIDFSEIASAQIHEDQVGKYVLVYLLSNDIYLKMEDIISFSKENKQEIKYTSAHERNDDFSKIYPTIEEWLELISKSSCVITNSYHGVVFSIIFQKRFLFIPYKKEKNNERAYSLLKKLGLENRIWEGSLNTILNDINYDGINDVLEEWRRKGWNYLKKALQ